jgi:hypothetical protein
LAKLKKVISAWCSWLIKTIAPQEISTMFCSRGLSILID